MLQDAEGLLTARYMYMAKYSGVMVSAAVATSAVICQRPARSLESEKRAILPSGACRRLLHREDEPANVWFRTQRQPFEREQVRPSIRHFRVKRATNSARNLLAVTHTATALHTSSYCFSTPKNRCTPERRSHDVAAQPEHGQPHPQECERNRDDGSQRIKHRL
jgi:hypothetical protein